jgi:uncharacterized protein
VGVPFDAITAFYDPAVQFGFQFEIIEGAAAGDSAAQLSEKTAKPEALPAQPADAAVATPAAPTPPDTNASSGGEVVRLDRFRKK